MQFILITSSGQQHVYYVRACAEIFKQIFGGQIHEVHKITIINT